MCKEQSRIAYLITVDPQSNRTQKSQNILSDAGFDVHLELSQRMESQFDKVLSNKNAQLSIYRRIIADKSRPWGYIFEDDLSLACKSQAVVTEEDCDPIDFSVEHDILGEDGIERKHDLYVYLGVCGGIRQREELYCGRCAHAYGLSREGAEKLIKFDKYFLVHPEGTHYMDVVMDNFCRKEGGFPVSYANYTSPQVSEHFGAFFQDRLSFPTLIG